MNASVADIQSDRAVHSSKQNISALLIHSRKQKQEHKRGYFLVTSDDMPPVSCGAGPCFVTFSFVFFLASQHAVFSFPYHGSQFFLGYRYWQGRYFLKYRDWDGFWNNYYGGRKGYDRATSQFSGQECSGCTCDNQREELQCSGTTL